MGDDGRSAGLEALERSWIAAQKALTDARQAYFIERSISIEAYGHAVMLEQKARQAYVTRRASASLVETRSASGL